jgi:hypothetical protein
VSALIISVASPAVGQTVLNFEGLADGERILDYYDGGFGSFGSGPGPDFDIIFGPDALALIDADAGGSGNFANEPSQDTIAFFLTGPGVVMNVPNGFTTGFSFFYSSGRSGQVTVYDGLHGTGNVLAVIPVVAQGATCGAGGDPTGFFACWDPVGVTFSGTAYSVNFGGVANQTGFDEITLESEFPGGCVRTRGYWGQHPGDWPVSDLTLGTVSYTQSELLAIIGNGGSNGLVHLAAQLIAAKLNAASGSLVTKEQRDLIDEADAMIGDLVVPPIGSDYLAPDFTEYSSEALDGYNNGFYPGGPVSCDDQEEEEEEEEEVEVESGV